ncbi:hypothetical protein AM423_004833 [Klebsiella pneumoniae]|nr:hypothetical protein AM423_004833 [Klebsiella pneumoniae]
MRLPYVIFTLAMLASVSTAQAIPNMWTSGFGMGVTEYIITSPDKVVFNLNCTGNPDAQNILGNDSNLLIVFYVQIMPDDFVMQLHRF